MYHNVKRTANLDNSFMLCQMFNSVQTSEGVNIGEACCACG